MTTPETSNSHPIWEGAIVGFLGAVEADLLPSDQIIPTMGQVCRELMQAEMLTSLGELQQYLRQREALVQLVAKPFRQEEMPRSDIRCVDVVTGEPRGHWLMVSVGPQEATRQLQAMAVSDEVNEAALANDTGMFVIEA